MAFLSCFRYFSFFRYYVCRKLYLSNHWTEFILAMLIFFVLFRRLFAWKKVWTFLPFYLAMLIFFALFRWLFAWKKNLGLFDFLGIFGLFYLFSIFFFLIFDLFSFSNFLTISKILAILCIWMVMSRPSIRLVFGSYFVDMK